MTGLKISGGLLAFFLLVICPLFTECSHVGQNEIGFAYNVTDGKAVNEENNPLLDFGWHWIWGWNAKFFIINSEVNSYNFTAVEDENSPYDESLSWDSEEGVTMKVEPTILGRVTDPWKFYTHHSKLDYSYSNVEGIQDARIYQAIRSAGQFVDVKMGELCQNAAADSIRKHPAIFTTILTKTTASYCEQFGFTVTDVFFPERFIFPGDSTIQRGREMLRDMNSNWEKKKKEVLTAMQKRESSIQGAHIEANKIIAEGQRRADHLSVEADALAKQLKTSIDQVGISGAMQLRMSELEGRLIAKGVIRKVYATDKSMFGRPFYGTNQ